jgi:hypothetical protein
MGKAEIVLQHRHVVRDDLGRLGTYGEKYGREGLATLGKDLARVLEEGLRAYVDMLQPKGGERAIAHSGQNRESDNGSVPPFNGGVGWHERENVPDLFERRDPFLAARGGDARVLFGGREIVSIVGVEGRAKTWFARG